MASELEGEAALGKAWGREHAKLGSQGPELGKGLACLRNRKEASITKANKSTAGYDGEAGRRDHAGPWGPWCGHGLTPSITGTPGGGYVAFNKVTGGRICHQASHSQMRGY